MADDQPFVHEFDTELTGFSRTLARHGLKLARGNTQILQVNVGLLCNQTCGHCHLNAGPGKTEAMTRQTADQVAAWAGRVSFETIDITGGAPEMNPDIVYLVETFAELAPKLTFRSNLSALNSGAAGALDGPAQKPQGHRRGLFCFHQRVPGGCPAGGWGVQGQH